MRQPTAAWVSLVLEYLRLSPPCKVSPRAAVHGAAGIWFSATPGNLATLSEFGAVEALSLVLHEAVEKKTMKGETRRD